MTQFFLFFSIDLLLSLYFLFYILVLIMSIKCLFNFAKNMVAEQKIVFSGFKCVL